MANPVLSRPETFAPAQTTIAATPGYAPQAPYTQAPNTQAPYTQPTPPQEWAPPQPPATTTGRMTLDDVLTKTALVMGAVVVVAVLSWKFLSGHLEILGAAALICGLAAFIIPLIGAFRRHVGPVFAFVYAVLEGVFLGAISGMFELLYPGIVFQAVVGTFFAAAATLAAFHVGKVRLSGKFMKVLFISLLAYAGVALLNLGLSFAGIDLGFIAGPTGEVPVQAWLFAGLGVVLAVFCLVEDFQYIEHGIQTGAPSSQSWTAAYGLTVTMVFLYIKILRILSYIRR
jgi:uncharacterized YccA/Bax inhibitor family protein